MAILQADDFADLVAGTLKELGRLRIQNIAQDLQEYPIVSGMFRKDKLTFGEGHGIQRNLFNRMPDSARFVGVMDEDDVNIEDLVDQMEVPWRHSETSWAVEYRTDMLMNRGASKIVDLVKLKRKAAMLALISKIEHVSWESAPAAADKKLPYNIQYWIVRNSSTGFNGGLPGDHTTVAGVSLSDSPNFKNYTAQYSAVSKADLVKKMREMHYKTGFKSPQEVALPDYRQGRIDRYRIYTNRDVTSGFEDIGEAQNESLGRDIASMEGGTMAFRGHPIITVPKLDEDTQDPVYFLDMSTFYPVCLKGNYFRESKLPAPRQHNVLQYFVDLSFNFLCVDRRRNGVIATA